PRDRTGVGPCSRRSVGAASRRSRPARLWRRLRRRAGPARPASAPPRAAIRARAACRARSAARDSRSGRRVRRTRGAACPAALAAVMADRCPDPARYSVRGRSSTLTRDVAPRRSRRLRGRARALAEAGVLGGLLALPLLRPDARRDLPLQQARPGGAAAGEL